MTPFSSRILLSTGAISLPYIAVACLATAWASSFLGIPWCPGLQASFMGRFSFALCLRSMLMSLSIALHEVALLPALMAASALVLSEKM
jgi:hypothetical protein